MPTSKTTGKRPTVAVAGCGYAGLTTAVILANCGYVVYAIEPLKERLQSIAGGKSFFYEAGVDPLLRAALKAKTILPTASYEEALPKSDIVFCCMGTPDNPDGSTNLTYVFNVAREFAKLRKPGALFVQKSTVPVGTGTHIRELFNEQGAPTAYVSNPEFLREGTAIADTLWADRVVIGSDNPAAAREVTELYQTIEASRADIGKLAGLSPVDNATPVEYITTGQNAAELVKVGANAFLALKLSFANSLAKLADKTGADIQSIMPAIGADRRIGGAFFNTGRGYGGGCFPKDVLGLIRSAQDYGVELGIMNAVHDLNESMPHYIIAKVSQELGGDDQALIGAKAAVLGLAFKAGTSDTRRSPAIEIANALVARGAKVVAYDPEAMEEARPLLNPTVKLTDSAEAALDQAVIVFVATDWPAFKSLGYSSASTSLKTVVDCMNCLDKSAIEQAGLRYIGVGR